MFTLAEVNTNLLDLAKWIPLLPAVALVVNGIVLGAIKPARKLAAVVTILAVGGSFALSVAVWMGMGDPAAFAEKFGHYTVHAFEWIHIGSFAANFSFYIDPLTVVMLLVVTGVGLLISIYASGYMAGDDGYFRFFAYIGLFIFAMTILVLADNLLLLYLGWEGVGLASYLLIGFYYRKPSARDAAKKAFIVNRVGDFGFALGLMGVFLVFGAISYDTILPEAKSIQVAQASGLTEGQLFGDNRDESDLIEGAELVISCDMGIGDTLSVFSSDLNKTLLLVIPFLLMLGAFGKSAQLPLHVWLPDAMEGPTPVSALIHAATMVTAGVYMIARLLPIFELSEYALYTVAIVGGVTALFAATIALCQYDIKRVWAYSTVSQLGYMFLGVGVLSTVGGVFHLFTHAFFKALLFLTAGSVMHALAGQLDMRKMSGLIRKMPITAILMLIGCLALAGFPFTAGYYSKDMILAEALVAHPWLGWLGIATALLTAFYTFRLWFRVFVGPLKYEMSNEHHGYPAHGSASDGEQHHDEDHGHHHGPHEMSWLMNGPLVLLAAGALLLGWLAHDWMGDMIGHSTAAAAGAGHHGEAHGHGEGMDAHTLVSLVTGIGGTVMILLAGYFFWLNRAAAERIAGAFGPVRKLLENKWYVDELYHGLIVMPLRALGWICYLFDRLIIDGLIIDGLLRYTPRAAGEAQTPAVRGMLQGFALAMVLGVVVVLAIVLWGKL
jgi:NADH-quinone oxidoreductase subunit L